MKVKKKIESKRLRVLIVGGSSLLATALKPVLEKFCEVLTAGRQKGNDIFLDLRDPVKDFSFPDNIDVVIHMAAYFKGGTDAEMLEAENVNVLGTLKLCQASTKFQVRHLILISSIFATLQNDSKYYGAYSLSKKHAEEIAQLHCTKQNLSLTILRPSQIYGSEESFRKHQPFLYTIADHAQAGKDILLFGSNDARRNFIHVIDLAEIISRVVTRRILGTFQCSYPSNLRYSQIAESAISAFFSKSKVKFLRDKPDIPDNIFKRDNSLYRAISFSPQISIKEGMELIALNRGIKK